MRRPVTGICLVLCLLLLVGCSAGTVTQGGRDTGGAPVIALAAASTTQAGAARGDSAVLSAVLDAVNSSDSVCKDIRGIIEWQLEDSEVSGEEQYDGDASMEETRAQYDEITSYIQQLDSQRADIDALSGGDSEGTKKTLAAAKEYYNMLSRLTGDLIAVFDYYFAIYDALLPFIEFEDPTTGESMDDLYVYGSALYDAVSQSHDMMAAVNPPGYISGSHGDLVKRLNEFTTFCSDFVWSIALEDPLRISSCIYRSERLSIMIAKCTVNMQEDIDAQFRQLQKRMDGSIAVLQGELVSNIGLLAK